MTARSLPVCLALSLIAAAARAEPPTRALELSAGWGAARMLLPTPDAERTISSRNGGLAVHARLLLRTTEGLSPLFDAGYAPLYRSDEVAPPIGAVARSSLAAGYVLGGVALGSGWLRPWAGMGAFRIEVRSALGGVRIAPSSLTFGYAAGLEAALVRRGRFSLALDARLLVLSEAETLALIGGASLGWDLASF